MIGGCAKLIVIAACLAVTGCGSSKPEKAFCKAENRVIPDDELMARALLGIWKANGEGSHDLSEKIKKYISENLQNNSTDTQFKIVMAQYVLSNPSCCSFEYDPKHIIKIGQSDLPMSFNSDVYYRNIMLYDAHTMSNFSAAAVSMCGEVFMYNQD